MLAPNTDKTRPMTDEMREALFNILGDITDLNVLDMYAGSGAIGIEALSRGAKSVDAVERAHTAVNVIKLNLKALGVEDDYKVFEKPAAVFVRGGDLNNKYNLIFADPPFNSYERNILDKLAKLLLRNGILILRLHGKEAVPEIYGTVLVKKKTYGDSVVCFYKQENS